MNSLTRLEDDDELGGLFTKSREYPLLSATQEHEIDAKKWEARDRLLKILAGWDAGRCYLHLWAGNLLDNRPSLETMVPKRHYYVLRREQGQVRRSEAGKKLLGQLRRQSAPGSKGFSKKKCLDILVSLELSPPLVAGLSHVLLGDGFTCEISQALRGWQTLWPEPVEMNAPLSSDDARDLRHWLREYFSSRDRLVNHNMRLVFSIAGKLTTATVPYPDLVQSGILGLIRAAEKFDYRAGNRFSTYAYNWINQAARRYMEDQRAVVRLPADLTARVNRLYRERLSFVSLNGQEPSAQQLAERLGSKTEAVRQLRQVGNLSLSLDSPYDDDRQTMGETMSGWVYPAPPSQSEQKSLHRCLMGSLDVLTQQEQQVITLRWGLTDATPLTRQEMAACLEVSAERIRQIEAAALGKLSRVKSVKEAFRDYYG